MNLDETFGERLKEERNRLHLTQEEFSKMMNIGFVTVNQYEKGKTYPTVKMLYTLRDLGFDIRYLIFGEKHPISVKEIPLNIFESILIFISKIEKNFVGDSFSDAQKLKLTAVILEQYINKIKPDNENNTNELFSDKDILTNLLF